jgi:sec-independent protein translocase protein TatC
MDLSQQVTFAEHIQELRRRLIWTVLFLVVGAGVGYFIHDSLIALLQQPLHDNLYYTTPGGAFNFIIKVCTVFGLIVALPMLIYQVFAFFGPLIKLKAKRDFVVYVIASLLLAVGGIAFAYFVSLPAALHFLVSFGDSSNIQSMITANEYFNFVLTYIAGFAVLFQVPLVILLIDKIKPMGPMPLLKATRYVILVSFIVAAIITPTPDPMNQALMAGPIIVLYLCSVAIVGLRSFMRPARAPVASQSARELGSIKAPTKVSTAPALLPSSQARLSSAKGTSSTDNALQPMLSEAHGKSKLVQQKQQPIVISDFIPRTATTDS